MYTNINTTTGIQSIKKFIQNNQDVIPEEFPSDLLLQAISLLVDMPMT